MYTHLKFPKGTLFLVTGGAGFIGSNLCEAILKLGYKIRCLDDLSTGKQANVDLFVNNPNYEFIKGDIKDLDTCMKACEGVDYVLNQAAWGSVPRSIEMPLFYCANNIQGTLNMMEAARQNKVKTFVYASSSSVYGDEAHLPMFAIIDVYTRYMVGWSLSNTMTAQWCVAVLREAFERHGCPEIINSDQGSQLYVELLEDNGIAISMDSRGRALDDIFIERLWRSVKQEYVYLNPCETGDELWRGLDGYFRFYNDERLHQSLGYKTPASRYLLQKEAA